MRILTVFVALGLAMGLSACDSGTASSTSTNSTTDTSVGSDTSTGSDTATGSDTSTGSDTATGTDTAATGSTWADVKGIFQTACAASGCHNATDSKYFDATSCSSTKGYSKVKSYISSGLMPKKPTTITADEKAKLLKWIADGATCP